MDGAKDRGRQTETDSLYRQTDRQTKRKRWKEEGSEGERKILASKENNGLREAFTKVKAVIKLCLSLLAPRWAGRVDMERLVKVPLPRVGHLTWKLVLRVGRLKCAEYQTYGKIETIYIITTSH